MAIVAASAAPATEASRIRCIAFLPDEWPIGSLGGFLQQMRRLERRKVSNL